MMLVVQTNIGYVILDITVPGKIVQISGKGKPRGFKKRYNHSFTEKMDSSLMLCKAMDFSSMITKSYNNLYEKE